jgi:hypothetical protein
VGVQIDQFVRDSGRIGRIWRGGCSQSVLTESGGSAQRLLTRRRAKAVLRRTKRRERLVACSAVPTDPLSVRWTDHARDKAQQLSFARHDVESALLDGHRKRRRNKGRAAWQVVAGRLVIAYEHPDGDDPLVARIVTIWRRR